MKLNKLNQKTKEAMELSGINEVPGIVRVTSEQSVRSEMTNENEEYLSKIPSDYIKDSKPQEVVRKRVVEKKIAHEPMAITPSKDYSLERDLSCRQRSKQSSLEETTDSDSTQTLFYSFSPSVIDDPYSTRVISSRSRHKLIRCQPNKRVFDDKDSGSGSHQVTTDGCVDPEIEHLRRKNLLLEQENARLRFKAMVNTTLVETGYCKDKDIWSERSMMLLIAFVPLHAFFIAAVLASSIFGK